MRKLIWLHKWSSLTCTLFLLVTCFTGLPLIFRDEINDWLSDDPLYEVMPAGSPRVDLDRITRESYDRYPGDIIISVSIDDDDPKIVVFMASSWDAFAKDQSVAHFLRFDARTARLLKESKPVDERRMTLTGGVLQLHRNLFAGMFGELLLATVAAAFIVSLVSGALLYGPFMRRLEFGTIRQSRSPRIKWLDVHNFLGIAIVVWMVVVGATGLMNELSLPLFNLWRSTDVRNALARSVGDPISPSRLGSLQDAFESARKAVPGMTVSSVIFPGGAFSTPYHYVFWAKGNSPLTAKLFQPILVDARDGEFDRLLPMPWYLRLLELSRPLHFGDYGGLPLKIIWALLDAVTILVLVTGIYLWLVRNGRADPRR
ncbi:PepSY-associated TM helix domain-containing protein [Bradyrhizobium sp.]|uniref:PepSY-associated TM helix domain-containing protein n=1 Tax=Bradyrhizobium sp. TaxID=376 RepID=UPI0039E6FEBD